MIGRDFFRTVSTLSLLQIHKSSCIYQCTPYTKYCSLWSSTGRTAQHSPITPLIGYFWTCHEKHCDRHQRKKLSRYSYLLTIQPSTAHSLLPLLLVRACDARREVTATMFRRVTWDFSPINQAGRFYSVLATYFMSYF